MNKGYSQPPKNVFKKSSAARTAGCYQNVSLLYGLEMPIEYAPRTLEG